VTKGQLLANIVCALRRDHVWRDFCPRGTLKHGHREWCLCCHSNRVSLDSGEVVVASSTELDSVRFQSALYEARWGEPPRRPLNVGERVR